MVSLCVLKEYKLYHYKPMDYNLVALITSALIDMPIDYNVETFITSH